MFLCASAPFVYESINDFVKFLATGLHFLKPGKRQFLEDHGKKRGHDCRKRFHRTCDRGTNAPSLRLQIGSEQRLGDNSEREPHHFLRKVHTIASMPSTDHADIVIGDYYRIV